MSTHIDHDNNRTLTSVNSMKMDTDKRPPSVVGKLKKEFLHFEKQEKGNRTFKDTLKNLGETSTLHGISKIASSRQIVVKVLWCILFIGTATVFIMQLIQLFRTFYSYPVQTTVSLEFNSIAFPAITLCNINPVKTRQLDLVPTMKQILEQGQTMNVFVRKRREATRKQKADGIAKFSSRSPSSNLGEENVKDFPQHQSSSASRFEDTDLDRRNIKNPLGPIENVVPQAKFQSAEKDIRRRKREALSTSWSDTLGPTSLHTESAPLFSQEHTQTTSMFQSSPAEGTHTLTPEYASVTPSDFSTFTPSPTPTFENNTFALSISGSNSNTNVQPTSSSAFWHGLWLPSNNKNTMSSASQQTFMAPPPSSISSASWYPHSDYSGSSNNWEAWYDYYSNYYHPTFYDHYYNYNYDFYDWYYYSPWQGDYSGGSFFYDQLHSKKDEWDERIENFKTVFKNESVETRQRIGHQKEDMVVAASFAGRVQNISHFQNFTSTEYGNCYTMASPKYVAWRSGPKYGFKLTLNLEIDEYMPNFSTGYGIRIVFHEPGTHPLPAHEGVTLSPGTETNIGLRMVRITRLQKPHGDCIDGSKFMNRYHKKYSISSCYEFCRIQRTLQECNCVPVEAPDGISLNSTVVNVCNVSEKAVKACLLEVDVRFDNGDYSCDCRGPCNETVYAKTMSSTYWPTDDYLYVLIAELCQQNVSDWIFICSNYMSMPYWELDRFRYNFLRVLIYFEDLNYETITEEPMYESVRFLSDIGGAMGLFLGASVLSFVEVIQLLLELFLVLKNKHLDIHKTRVSNFNSE